MPDLRWVFSAPAPTPCLSPDPEASSASLLGTFVTQVFFFLTRYDGEVSEPLVGRQGSRVSMRVARGSASLLPSHGRGIWPRDVLKKVSRGLSRVEAGQGTLQFLLQCHSSKAALFWHSAFFILQLLHLYMTTGNNGINWLIFGRPNGFTCNGTQHNMGVQTCAMTAETKPVKCFS